MTVSGTVMAHQKRAAWAEDLSERLGLPITWDRISDRHETGLRCLQAGIDSDATHHVVVQDDALVCADLIAGLEQATAVSGDRIVGLYAGHSNQQIRRMMHAARAAGTSWVVRPRGMTLWGVGIVIPTVHLPALIAHYEKSREQNYDRRIERWADSAKVECWFTAPSLVDHRTGEANPSLVPGRTSLERHTCWFIGENGSALAVDWTRVPTVSNFWRNPQRPERVQRAAPDTPQARRLQAAGWEPVMQTRCSECGSRHYVPVVPQLEEVPA